MSPKAHVLKPSPLSYCTIRKLTNLRIWSLEVNSQSVYRILRHQPLPVSIFASGHSEVNGFMILCPLPPVMHWQDAGSKATGN